MIQMYGFLHTYQQHTSGSTSVLSITSSILAVAFTMSSIDFDIDLNVENRLHFPDCYGYIKDSNASRLSTMLCLIAFSSSQLAMKCCAIGLLMIANPHVLVAYLLASFFLFFFIKIVRNDLRTFNLSGLHIFFEYVFIFGLLFVWKILNDYTSSVTQRLPKYMGERIYGSELISKLYF